MTAFYRVEHETRYAYSASVTTSQHVAYLRPRALPGQRVRRSELFVEPLPARHLRRVDYFGNAVDQFTILKPHTELLVRGACVVEVDEVRGPDPERGPAWEEVREALAYHKTARVEEGIEHAFASPYVVWDEELREFARPSFPAGRPLVAAAIDLMHRIHGEFRFDPGATSITTPVRKVLAERRGVCQDFAHLHISCLRSLGLAARYVSGYLLTDPPPGQARLIGADASHAWLSVHVPGWGWLDLDPTNDVLPSERHVTLAWGRDFGDVSPLRGVILGGAEHSLKVGVSVLPLIASEAEAASGEATTG
jgi:transglutaminase-like putative cysteine protease